MSFIDQARRTLQYNRNLLNKKNKLEELSKPIHKNIPSELDQESFRKNSSKQFLNQQKRNLSRKIALSVFFIGVIIVFSLYYLL